MTSKQWHARPVEDLVEGLETNLREGLSDAAAEQRLQRHGPNRIAEPQEPSRWRIIGRQLLDPLVLLLIVAAAISGGVLGEVIETTVIVVIVILNALIGAAQETRAATALAELRKLSAPNARVIRGGKERAIPATELIPGDLLSLAGGDRIPADARLIEASHLQVDESSLTGESFPVVKQIGPVPAEAPVAERESMIFAGTAVTTGRAKAVVVATGLETEMGSIASMLEEAEPRTPLQRELAKVGGRIAILAVIAGVVIFLLGLARREPAETIFLVAVALAVAAIPEGLPAIVALSLANGVQALARSRAVVRRLPAVETLGSATVICSDKTGTLTRNEIWLEEADLADLHLEELKGLQTDRRVRRFVEIAALCNDASFGSDGHLGDPTEVALLRAVESILDVDQLRRDQPRLDEASFDSDRKRMSTLHRADGGLTLFAKGAPESIIKRSSRFLDQRGVEPFKQDRAQRASEVAVDMAARGLRTLGLAYRPLDHPPDNLVDAEEDLIFVGLAGLRDELRPESSGSVAEAEAAGIRVVMITGDHEVTARAVGNQLGLTGKVMTGRRLHELDEEALAREIEDISVFARVDPGDKVRIVKAWQRRQEVVAMTGDGVNDAPALRLSDIGVAMGSGTDVAREAADIVLTDDNFATIVAAVREGRRIFQNLHNVVTFLLAHNLGEVLVMLGGFLLFPSLGAPLGAAQLLWVNLVTDGLPALALGMDRASEGLMDLPPRRGRSLLNAGRQIRLLALGCAMAVGVLTVLFIGFGSLSQLRTVAFSSLVLAELVFAFRVRYESGLRPKRNRLLEAAILGSLLLQVLAVETVAGNRLFDTAPLGWNGWGMVLLALLITGALMEAVLRSRIGDPRV